jgi:hypothetical protein
MQNILTGGKHEHLTHSPVLLKPFLTDNGNKIERTFKIIYKNLVTDFHI